MSKSTNQKVEIQALNRTKPSTNQTIKELRAKQSGKIQTSMVKINLSHKWSRVFSSKALKAKRNSRSTLWEIAGRWKNLMSGARNGSSQELPLKHISLMSRARVSLRTIILQRIASRRARASTQHMVTANTKQTWMQQEIQASAGWILCQMQ